MPNYTPWNEAPFQRFSTNNFGNSGTTLTGSEPTARWSTATTRKEKEIYTWIFGCDEESTFTYSKVVIQLVGKLWILKNA